MAQSSYLEQHQAAGNGQEHRTAGEQPQNHTDHPDRQGHRMGRLTGTAFVAALAFLTLWGLVKPDLSYSESENRYLAQRPEMSLDSLLDGSFMTSYEDYITDQFPERNLWIRLRTQTLRLTGHREINKVYLGKDDYLLETHLDVDNGAAYRNADILASYLQRESAALGGGHVSLILSPTATVTLTQDLPSHAATWDQDRLIRYVYAKAGQGEQKPVCVDAAGQLAAHRQEEIYYRTDHHWTTRGAFYVYEAWAKAMGKEVPQEDEYRIIPVSDHFRGTIYSKLNWAPAEDTIEEWDRKDAGASHVSIEETNTESDSLYYPDHLKTRDQYSYFLDGNHPVEVIDTEGSPEGTLLVIKDSYAHCFVPFLTRDYQRIVMVDLRYLKEPVSSICDEYGVTDVCVLYNAVHFSEANLGMLLDFQGQ